MTTTKTKYTVGIYCSGIKDWSQESCYDHYTAAPKIVAVATSEEAAQAWIDRKMEEQEATIRILPGQGFHRTYSTVSLSKPSAYLSRQDAARDHVNISLRKKALIADSGVEKIR